MGGDTTVRGGAALILIAGVAIVASLYNPLSIPVEIEVALPIGLLLGIGAILLLVSCCLITTDGRS
jgi:hypothetical protein